MNDIEVTIRISGQTVEHMLTQTGAQTAPLTTVEQENLRIVREHLEGIRARDINRVVAGLDDSFQVTSDTRLGLHPSRTGDRANYLDLFRQLWGSFPDTSYHPEFDLIVRGEYVVVPWWGSGTQTGSWAGHPASGKRMDVHGCSYYQVRNKKIVALWDYWDRGALMHQVRGGGRGGEGGWGGGSEAQGTESESPAGLRALLSQLEGVLRQMTEGGGGSKLQSEPPHSGAGERTHSPSPKPPHHEQ